MYLNEKSSVDRKWKSARKAHMRRVTRILSGKILVSIKKPEKQEKQFTINFLI